MLGVLRCASGWLGSGGGGWIQDQLSSVLHRPIPVRRTHAVMETPRCVRSARHEAGSASDLQQLKSLQPAGVCFRSWVTSRPGDLDRV